MDDGSVIVWDTQSGKEIFRRNMGLYMATTTRRSGNWSQPTNPDEPVYTRIYPLTEAGIDGIASSPAGKYAAIAFGRTLMLDVDHGLLYRNGASHSGARRVAISDDGQLLASAPWPKVDEEKWTEPLLRAEDLGSGSVAELRDDGFNYASLSFLRNPQRLIAVAQGGRVYSWKIGERHATRRAITQYQSALVTSSPDGAQIALSVRSAYKRDYIQLNPFIAGEMFLMNAGDWSVTGRIHWGIGEMADMQYLDNETLITVQRNGRIYVLPVADGQELPMKQAIMLGNSLSSGPDRIESSKYIELKFHDLSQAELKHVLIALASCHVPRNSRAIDKDSTLRAQKKSIHHLVDIGTDIDSRTGVEQWSALHWAAFHDDAPMVDYLLEYGASPTIRDARGRTPAEIAKMVGASDVVDRLREEQESQ